jgi:hypothetical protein
MATVDKNFRIKNGLVVEGTTGTINGHNILTESAGDSYILNLVGGATLVKSVDTVVFNVDGSGKLTVNANVFDAYGAASSAQSAAISTSESYTDSAISTEVTNRNSAIATSLSTAESYTDSKIATEVTNRNSAIATSLATAESYADTKKSEAITTSEGYTDTKISAEVTRANSAYDPAGSASSAQSTAATYTDGKIATEVTARNSAIAAQAATTLSTAESYADTKKSEAITTSESYTDSAISALINGAPSILDTLREIDNAINNDANFSTTVLNNIATALATGESYTNSAIATEVTNRNTAIATAKAEAISSANATQAAANTDQLNGTTPFTLINVNSASLVTAAKVSVATAGSATAYSWVAADYSTAKLIVKFATGTHTQVQELLVTLDSNNNVAETQWAEVGTNGELGSVSCTYASGNVNVIAVTNQASTTVTTYATLLK